MSMPWREKRHARPHAGQCGDPRARRLRPAPRRLTRGGPGWGGGVRAVEPPTLGLE